ncbi:MAG: 2OG-Fe(II) oxygenase [Panacagrimonas sp.]
MTQGNTLLGTLIAERLRGSHGQLAQQFSSTAPIRYFVLDDLLPRDVATDIHRAFPAPANMRLRDTFRERKYVSAQMDRHDLRVEAALFAFHAEAVVQAVQDITGKHDLQPDPQLYAGGVSLMGRGHFLNPHIDNSHDAERVRWRNLNLLFYVTPDWPESAGGDLELWPDGIRSEPVVIGARFNRLVVMETHQRALHSVRPVAHEAPRSCISNYYFGDTPMRDDQAFHVTSFRARPGQPIRDLVSRADSALRMWVRRGVRKGLVRSDQRYQR